MINRYNTYNTYNTFPPKIQIGPFYNCWAVLDRTFVAFPPSAVFVSLIKPKLNPN